MCNNMCGFLHFFVNKYAYMYYLRCTCLNLNMTHLNYFCNSEGECLKYAPPIHGTHVVYIVGQGCSIKLDINDYKDLLFIFTILPNQIR